MAAPEVEGYRTAVRRAVLAALSPHGASVANVEEGEGDGGDWRIDIRPAAVGAARVAVELVGDDGVTLGLGQSHVYLWARDPDTLAQRVHDILAAVFAGRIIEAQSRDDRPARVRMVKGELQIGATRVPWPWRWRRTRTYQPYSTTP